jgi:hypothetical protein
MEILSNFGISYSFSETDDCWYVPYPRMLEFIRLTLEDNLKQNESL